MDRYDPKQIEPKWQRIWADERTWEVSNEPDERPKAYVLEMLPYPSGEPHIGHLKIYSVGDAVAHFRRRARASRAAPDGLRRLRPAGGEPRDQDRSAPARVDRGLDRRVPAPVPRLGISIDWTREFGTHEPRYYRWTQWIFLRLLERGLAYRKEAAVKWCPNDQTVLANEQVIDGRCERCGHEVEVRQLEQWFFRITEYADRLLEDIEDDRLAARTSCACRGTGSAAPRAPRWSSAARRSASTTRSSPPGPTRSSARRSS